MRRIRMIMLALTAVMLPSAVFADIASPFRLRSAWGTIGIVILGVIIIAAVIILAKKLSDRKKK